MRPIAEDFFDRDLFEVAQDLLGIMIVSNTEGQPTVSQIVETEAYDYPDDLGSHAYKGKRTPRNESMYLKGGHIYMYLCYGTNNMLNFAAGKEGEGHAILVRAVRPVDGIQIMQQRRGVDFTDYRLCGGPGKVCQALALTKAYDGISVFHPQSPIQLYYPDSTNDEVIIKTPRVGMSRRVGESSNLLYRYYIEPKYVSRPLKLVYPW